MGLAVVREGLALVKVWDPRGASVGGRLEPAWLPVFYNPVMEFNRDVSVAALQAYVDSLAPHRPVTVVEPLTATGVRAVRYALEVDGVGLVVAGDIDPAAVRLAAENARLNRVEGSVRVVRADANALMYRMRYEDPTPVLAVDLDPYGSPAPFLRAALALVGHGGLLAMTATDIAVLGGSKRLAALRRYHARMARTPQAGEVAVRVLLAYTAMVAAEHDKAVVPLLAYKADHYVRVYVRVERGARRADRTLEENLGSIVYCADLGYALMAGPGEGVCPQPSREARVEPAWAGPLFSRGFVERVRAVVESREYLATRRRALKLLDLILEEEPLQLRVHQRTDALASALRTRMPGLSGLLEALRAAGYMASRTHFAPTGFRTDAGYSEIAGLFTALARP